MINHTESKGVGFFFFFWGGGGGVLFWVGFAFWGFFLCVCFFAVLFFVLFCFCLILHLLVMTDYLIRLEILYNIWICRIVCCSNLAFPDCKCDYTSFVSPVNLHIELCQSKQCVCKNF